MTKLEIKALRQAWELCTNNGEALLKLEGVILTTWNVEDVMGQIDNMDSKFSTLNEEDARCILDSVESNFDASMGICWDTIESAIVDYFQHTKMGE